MLRTFGSLWAKKSKDGRSYLSGELETPFGKIKINVFPNDKKEKENQPDYRVTYSLDDEKGRQGGGRPAGLPGLDDINAGGSTPVIQLDEDEEDSAPFPSL